MTSSALKRLAVILCVCLLLQEFAPVSTAHINHHAQHNSSLNDNDDVDNSNDDKDEGSKTFYVLLIDRNILTILITTFVKNIIKLMSNIPHHITFSVSIF